LKRRAAHALSSSEAWTGLGHPLVNLSARAEQPRRKRTPHRGRDREPLLNAARFVFRDIFYTIHYDLMGFTWLKNIFYIDQSDDLLYNVSHSRRGHGSASNFPSALASDFFIFSRRFPARGVSDVTLLKMWVSIWFSPGATYAILKMDQIPFSLLPVKADVVNPDIPASMDWGHEYSLLWILGASWIGANWMPCRSCAWERGLFQRMPLTSHSSTSAWRCGRCLRLYHRGFEKFTFFPNGEAFSPSDAFFRAHCPFVHGDSVERMEEWIT
jgi:hypothetical protein